MDGTETPPTAQPVIRTIAMPADTNPAGDIFGGWLMSQMDLAAGNLAALTARGRAATIAVDGMRFHRPVKVGDEVSLFATLTKRGRTSMRPTSLPGVAGASRTRVRRSPVPPSSSSRLTARAGRAQSRAEVLGPGEGRAPTGEEMRALLLIEA
jgi:hypothetical protein